MTSKLRVLVLLLLCGALPASARKHKRLPLPPPPRPVATLHLAARTPTLTSTRVIPPRPVQGEQPARGAPSRDLVQRESKIEFDERLVQGQTASGAVYLFQRGESEFQSMVHLPTSFRERTIERILGEKVGEGRR